MSCSSVRCKNVKFRLLRKLKTFTRDINQNSSVSSVVASFAHRPIRSEVWVDLERRWWITSRRHWRQRGSRRLQNTDRSYFTCGTSWMGTLIYMLWFTYSQTSHFGALSNNWKRKREDGDTSCIYLVNYRQLVCACPGATTTLCCCLRIADPGKLLP